MIFTPSFCAFSSFEPASSPARTKAVFLLTLPLTLPPSDSILAVACSRESVGSKAVRTKELRAGASRLHELLPESLWDNRRLATFHPAHHRRLDLVSIIPVCPGRIGVASDDENICLGRDTIGE